jgi:hypothetical protein
VSIWIKINNISTWISGPGPAIAAYNWLYGVDVMQYLHRSPASRRRRRNGNSVHGGITGQPCSWGYKYGDLALQVGGVSNLREYNMVISSAGLGPENDSAGEDQQQL